MSHGTLRYAAAVMAMCHGQFARAATTETVIHSFDSPKVGYGPEAKLLIGKAGTLYGTTSNGYGRVTFGSVFSLKPRPKGGGYGVTLLHEFLGQQASDGAKPVAAVAMDPSGALYGTTLEGGSRNNGTIFHCSRSSRRHGLD